MKLTREQIKEWRAAFQLEFSASVETNALCDLALAALEIQEPTDAYIKWFLSWSAPEAASTKIIKGLLKKLAKKKVNP